jgi:F0F1-type ATP synthase assembly protein I
MPFGMRDSKEMGFYLSLAQIALEFVAPLIAGVFLDWTMGWMPWATVSGAVLGFVGGMVHLVTMAARHDQPGSQPKREERPR